MADLKMLFWVTRVNQKCHFLGYVGWKMPKKPSKKQYVTKAWGGLVYKVMAFIFGLETLQDILWAPTDTLDHISHASTDSPHLSTRDAEKYWKSMIFEKIQNVPKSNAECFLAAFLGSGCPYNTLKIRFWQYDIIIFILRMLIESIYFGQFAPKMAFFSKFTFASSCPIG